MNLTNLEITKIELEDFESAIQKEWLITNGLGGYASSTVLGINTRKYHGLLVAALHPPGDRTVCLAKLDEEITIEGKNYLLGTNEFIDTVFPKGFKHLSGFSISPFPKYVFNVNGLEIEKTAFMPEEKNVTAVLYRILNKSNFEIEFRVLPLTTCRHFHKVVDKDLKKFKFDQTQTNEKSFCLSFEDPKIDIALKTTTGRFIPKPNWIKRIFYREEARRGESSIDDCYQPGCFQFIIEPKSQLEFAILASASTNSFQNAEQLSSMKSFNDVRNSLEEEQKRKDAFLKSFYEIHSTVPLNEWTSWVLLAANSFTVAGFNNSRNIIAGYHWFETWGRDTFISLPGLLLVPHRFEEARRVFTGFNNFCTLGLIPNYLSDLSHAPSCNTVDATMWYINAVLQYLKYTGDYEFIRNQLWPTLKEIVENHKVGTAFGIQLDSDGLLMHGSRLTWMDADINGEAVTPRAGKAVEIQALWYNSLRTMQLLASKFDEKSLSESYALIANRAKFNFNEKFWNSKRNCLFDVLGESAPDPSLRPNQIIAVSLDFKILDREKNSQIVKVVENELLTRNGLMTIERIAPVYKGTYAGDRINRDRAYHNGTIWPWLLGPFITAFLSVNGNNPKNRNYAKNFVEPLFNEQIRQAGLGLISEIFDGDEPHLPRGCISQAWSVAEPLRAYVEDILQIRPKHENEVLTFYL